MFWHTEVHVHMSCQKEIYIIPLQCTNFEMGGGFKKTKQKPKTPTWVPRNMSPLLKKKKLVPLCLENEYFNLERKKFKTWSRYRDKGPRLLRGGGVCAAEIS